MNGTALLFGKLVSGPNNLAQHQVYRRSAAQFVKWTDHWFRRYTMVGMLAAHADASGGRQGGGVLQVAAMPAGGARLACKSGSRSRAADGFS